MAPPQRCGRLRRATCRAWGRTRGAVSTDGRLRKRFAGRSRRGARVCPGSRARENGASPCAKPTGHPAGARPAQWRPGPQAGSPARAGCRGAQLICSDSGRATRPRRTPRPPAPRGGHCASRAASHVLRVSRTRMHLILMTAREARGGPFSDHLSPFYRREQHPNPRSSHMATRVLTRKPESQPRALAPRLAQTSDKNLNSCSSFNPNKLGMVASKDFLED